MKIITAKTRSTVNIVIFVSCFFASSVYAAEEFDTSQQTVLSPPHGWTAHFQQAIMEDNNRNITLLVQEKVRDGLSQEEKKVVEDHVGFLSGSSYSLVRQLLTMSFLPDNFKKPLSLLSETKIKEAAQQVATLTKEKQKEFLSTVLASDYPVEAKMRPLLLYEFEQAGVELDSVSDQITLALKEYRNPGAWEETALFRFWPTRMLSPWQDRVKKYHKKLVQTNRHFTKCELLQTNSHFVKALLMEKVDTRLKAEEEELLQSLSPFLKGNPDCNFLLARHRSNAYWEWSRSFEEALSREAENTAMRLLQKKQGSSLSQEEVGVLKRRLKFLPLDARELAQSLLLANQESEHGAMPPEHTNP